MSGRPGPATVVDKRFRRADVRPARRARTWGRVWQIGRVVAGLALLTTAVVYASAGVVGARLLAVDRVTVRGHHRLSTAEVDALLAGVRGESILLVDLERYRAALLDSPWVADVTLRRRLPSTIDVSIIERDPIAIARLGHQLYLIDDEGMIIDEYGPPYRDLDLAIVDGLAAPRSTDGPPIDRARAQLAARFFTSLDARPDLARIVSQVDVSRAENVVVVLAGDPTALHLGNGAFVERLQTYLDLTPTLEGRGRTVDYVDLRFGDRVFVRDVK